MPSTDQLVDDTLKWATKSILNVAASDSRRLTFMETWWTTTGVQDIANAHRLSGTTIEPVPLLRFLDSVKSIVRAREYEITDDLLASVRAR